MENAAVPTGSSRSGAAQDSFLTSRSQHAFELEMAVLLGHPAAMHTDVAANLPASRRSWAPALHPHFLVWPGNATVPLCPEVQALGDIRPRPHVPDFRATIPIGQPLCCFLGKLQFSGKMALFRA